MKNKILLIIIITIIGCGLFAQGNTTEPIDINSNANITGEEDQNVFDVGNNNSNNNKNTDYNALENKIYNQLKIINEECLNKLKLTKTQKEKVLKLQESYMNIAKAHGILLKEAYIDFNEAYKKDPNSKDTKAKKEKLQKLAQDTKEDYAKYQESLFKILTVKQRKLYNEYIKQKIKEYQAEWNKKYGPMQQNNGRSNNTNSNMNSNSNSNSNK